MRIVMTAEKPSVARAYADALDLDGKESKDGKITGHSNWDGNDYTVTWSIGHLVTMSYPEKYDQKYKKWNFDDLPFLPEKYKYELIPDGKKQFQVIKALYNDPATDRIILAGDSGREGLYIQALILMLAGDNRKADKKVLWIDSQTKDEIRRGLKEAKPLSAYENLRQAGYMRAIEDYAFGLNYSRMLSCKFGREFNEQVKGEKWKVIAVGRVMTCVLGMTVDREREIRDFVPMPFYKILGGNENINSAWLIDKDSAYAESPDIYENKGFKNHKKAEEFLALLDKDKTLKVHDISDKKEKKKAPLLYNLAELQAECSKRFKISPDQTLSIAQKLYEGQLITYPRTDARVLSTAVCKEIEGNLKGLMRITKHNVGYVKRILTMDLHSGIEKTQYCDDKKITDHYAMIPTGKGNPSGLSEMEEAIYHMIVDRFLCIFFPQAEYAISTITLIHSCGERFRASEKSLVKAGFLEILGTETVDTSKEKFSARFKKGDVLPIIFTIEDGKTTPPSRYTSGSMILAMENAGKLIEDEDLRAQIKTCGIGTSATRAGILEKLVKTGYLNLNKKTQVLTPHADGEAVYDIVKKTIAGFLTPETTASWEKGLSMIENGEITFNTFKEKMETEIVKTYKRISIMEGGGEDHFTAEDTGIDCPFCGGNIVTARKGFRCENFKGKGKGCGFYLGEIGGVTFTVKDLTDLVTNKKTATHEFKKKDGSGTFKATMAIIDGKIGFQFEDDGHPRLAKEETNYKCPVCNAPVVKTDKGFMCTKYKKGCNFFLGSLGGVTFTEEDMDSLIDKGETPVHIFTKKSGLGKYAASLIISNEKKSTALKFVN